MSQKKTVINGFLCLVGGSAMLVSTQVGAATAVSVKDSAGVAASCGDLVNLITTPNNVTIETSGTCIGVGDGPQAVTIGNIAVDDGAVSTSIDVADHGVTVKLPFSIVGVSQPALGNATYTGTNITYTSPATVTGTQNTSFSYTIQDATNAQATGIVQVAVNHVDAPPPPPPPPSGNCVATSTLHCKGSISLVGVAKRGNSLALGHYDVWEFTYDSSRKGVFNHTHGNQKEAIISTIPDASLSNPVDARCVQIPWAGEVSFSFNEQNLANQWECPLVNGQTYYLKFKLNSESSPDANYYLNTDSVVQ